MKKTPPLYWLILAVVVIVSGALLYAFRDSVQLPQVGNQEQNDSESTIITQSNPIVYGTIVSKEENRITVSIQPLPPALQAGPNPVAEQETITVLFSEKTSIIEILKEGARTTGERIGTTGELQPGDYLLTDPVKIENNTATPAVIRFSKTNPY